MLIGRCERINKAWLGAAAAAASDVIVLWGKPTGRQAGGCAKS